MSTSIASSVNSTSVAATRFAAASTKGLHVAGRIIALAPSEPIPAGQERAYYDTTLDRYPLSFSFRSGSPSLGNCQLEPTTPKPLKLLHPASKALSSQTEN